MKHAIYSPTGKKLAGDSSLPENLSEELLLSVFPVIFDDCLFSRLDNGEISAVQAGEAALTLLTKLQATGSTLNKDKLLFALLMGQYKGEEAKEACNKLHYIYEKRRLSISIYLIEPMAKGAEELLVVLFAQGEAETLRISDHELALVYDCTDEQDDVIDLCGAIRESINNELETDAHIGIGSMCENAFGLAQSYEHGQAAVGVGKKISFHGGIWVYSRLFAELLLVDLPKEALARQRLSLARISEAIDEDTASLLEELFAQNFNISKTARRLYMHRNTMIYRLDKLQKTTGLDMRKFDDAVALRLFTALERLHK